MKQTAPASAAPPEHREILAAFLQEARGILQHHPIQLAYLRAHPHKQEPLMAIRRGFHSLKGGGRMAGQDELAALAWEVEQTLNQLLRQGKPAEAGVLKLIELASAAFREGIEALETRGRASEPPDFLTRLAQRLRACEQDSAANKPD